MPRMLPTFQWSLVLSDLITGRGITGAEHGRVRCNSTDTAITSIVGAQWAQWAQWLSPADVAPKRGSRGHASTSSCSRFYLAQVAKPCLRNVFFVLASSH
ncbi:hypothetical protein F4808DRAFT_356041 [Astrocystis sublimbata]|nr:hypothetical protein F4808DRAFT_356041 [Astrocystis sublimbata]